jgi:lipopolysaccharide transport system ATP-binding protein
VSTALPTEASTAAPGEVLVRVEGLGKRYPVLARRADRARALADILRGRAPSKQVEVLADVGFEVRRGESLGIVGVNGAGKSTLLKLITGVLTPSAGRVAVHGRVGALLELGAGFHPEHTGRDNVRMAAALHGLAGAALAAKMPEIQAFADIGEAIDEPVKHYSSGMVVRLGFAVIAALRPDLLITDEVLAVGDEGFQRKCIRWIDDYLASGGTLLLVAHSTYHVQKLCRRALWLHEGRVRALGDAFDVTQRYGAFLESLQPREAGHAAHAADAVLPYALEAVRVNGSAEGEVTLPMGGRLALEVELSSVDGRAPVLLAGLVRADGTPVYGVGSDMDGVALEPLPRAPGTRDDAPARFRARLAFDPVTLLPGSYTLRVHPLDPEGLRLFDTWERAVRVTGEAREYGLVRLPHAWGGEGGA